MPNKYPGGYQIIDLGDLSKVTGELDTTIEVPGLYERIETSSKPVILTGTGTTGYGIDAFTLSKATYYRDSKSEAHMFLMRAMDSSNLSISYAIGLEITPSNKVVDYDSSNL